MGTNNALMTHAAELELQDNYVDTLLEWFDHARECESNGADAVHAMAGMVKRMMEQSKSLPEEKRRENARAVHRRMLAASALMDAAAKMLKSAERETIAAFAQPKSQTRSVGLETREGNRGPR